MPSPEETIDVLCLGHACYDLVFNVPHHPGEDEKMFAQSLLGCGGGPAANAAVIVAKLGYKSAFSGYLGQDLYGINHLAELQSAGVNTDFIQRGNSPTPLSVVLVKPDGKRALLNYKGSTLALEAGCIDFQGLQCKTLLFDGHEPQLSLRLLQQFDRSDMPSVLDAGSVHEGTLSLMHKVSHLVCSEKFAQQYAGSVDNAFTQLAEVSPAVVITLGERGLIWRQGHESGQMAAPPIMALDTTGAGDAFHGAFAAALAAKKCWHDILRYASVAGALCCTKIGARPGLPDKRQVERLLSEWHS